MKQYRVRKRNAIIKYKTVVRGKGVNKQKKEQKAKTAVNRLTKTIELELRSKSYL